MNILQCPGWCRDGRPPEGMDVRVDIRAGRMGLFPNPERPAPGAGNSSRDPLPLSAQGEAEQADSRMVCRHFPPGIRPQGRVAAYRRKVWPPEPKLFNGGPIGLTYCIQTWFRYYLQQWIDNAMSEIESREGVYSLDFGREAVMASRDRQECAGSSSQGAIGAIVPPPAADLLPPDTPPPWR